MTYEFKVTPDDLDKTSSQLAALATGSAKAVDYAKQNLDVEGNSGLALKPVIDRVVEICADLAENYTRLGTITSTAAAELAKAATMYRTTDRNFAEQLDKTYPSGVGK
ncbi:type VII secretion target [Nocardia sp. NPDC050718]|uniref:type VII secretion target n=1 Tax=Nocardia sp. NPDC050718 TaxID=3155788 RepID=UPI0033DB7D3A